jgi:cytosine deaminase
VKTERVVVKNATLRGRTGLWSILVEDGRIGEISKNLKEGKTGIVLDAGGSLVTESFAIAHLHLDKVRTADRTPKDALYAYQRGNMDTRTSISLASALKRDYNRREIASRARGMLEEALQNGVTHLRAFADTGTRGKLEAVKALLELKDSFKGRVSLQIVAFPQEGIETDPGAEDYVEDAIKAGADVVGGIPWLETSTQRQQKHIDKMFSIAKRFDRPLAMLVDDEGDPKLRTLEMLARKTIHEGWQGKVQACHARAMGSYGGEHSRSVAQLCAKAGVGIVTSPHTGPISTRVDLLQKSGVVVALGQDDCSDAYYPYGRCNMLEVAFLASHLLRMMGPSEVAELYDMVTNNPAKIMNVPDFGLRQGATANLIVLRQKTLVEALAYQARPKLVISHGIAQSSGTI